MIVRSWHGYTTPAKADTHEYLLRGEIFTGIVDREIPGLREIQLLRYDLRHEVTNCANIEKEPRHDR